VFSSIVNNTQVDRDMDQQSLLTDTE